MDPREFQEFARELVVGRRPVQVRTAISRAYYGVFHVAVQVLEEMGFRISKGPAGHGEVRQRLRNSHDNEVMRVGSQLADLLGKRIQADYRLNDTSAEDWNTANTLVEQANRMITRLDRVSSGPKRAHIISAIRDWERRVSATGQRPTTPEG